MSSMFAECKELEYLDLSNFNTSNVNDMSGMFNKCRELKEIKGINNFNTSKVTTMRAMFGDCNELKNLNLSNFNTSNVKNMFRMFGECFELEYLDLSNFNTSNVTDMSYMFSKCYKLKEIKGIDNFNFGKVVNIDEMFTDCNELKKINSGVTYQLNESIQNVQPVNQSRIKKLITVYFTSSSQHIQNFPLSSYNTDIFSILEEKLYNEKPELKHMHVYFLSNGKLIDTSLSLEQNNIKENDAILIQEN